MSDTNASADPEAPLAERLKQSTLVLVAANLLPVVGVVFWDWDLFLVLALFWLENVFIGLFAIVKLSVSGSHRRYRDGFFLPAFFLVHYGGFMAGHAVLLMALFADPNAVNGQLPDPGESIARVARLDIGIAALALFLSHTWSFVRNFLGSGEREKLTVGGAMALPYQRMFITHVALLVGGYFLQEQGQPLAGLLILTALKTALDVVLHRREHRRLAP